MFDSEEECVMDFKAEEKRTQLSNFCLNDTASVCSTLSASEVDSYDGNDLTPPLFYKLKKARVLIKKLPRDVLAKYDVTRGYKETPLRSSGRIKDKHLPVGKYLALHKNKPLHKVIKKKKNRKTKVLNFVKNENCGYRKSSALKRNILPGHGSTKQTLKSTNLCNDSPYKSKDIATPKNFTDRSYSSQPRKLLCNKFLPTIGNNDYKNKATSITITSDVDKRNILPSNKNRSLHERIASTRTIHSPTETSRPNLPDVVVARHIPPISSNHLPRNEIHIPKTVPSSIGRWNVQNEKTSVPLITSSPKVNYTPPVQSKVFPAFITPAASVNQSRHLTPSNTAPKRSNDGLHCQTTPTPRKFSVRAFKIPNNSPQPIAPISSNTAPRRLNDGMHRQPTTSQRKFSVRAFKIPNNSPKPTCAIPVTSPKVFVVNQSLLGINPSNVPPSEGKTTNNLIDKENTAGNGREFLEEDVEKQIEPEVIKRIVYHSKSVQTKFTCNSSICGLVDAGAFNLNCFYCYEIFPLHKWLEFKEHIKVVHQVEEGENSSDSDVEDASANMSSTPMYMNENDKRNFTTKAVNTTKEVNTKLPLEPKLVAQNKVAAVPSKLFSSTPKPTKPSKSVDQSGTSNRSVNFENSHIGEIVSLDSDDCDPDMEDLDDVNKTTKADLQIEKKVQNQKSEDNRVVKAKSPEIILSSLPHITIKKIPNASPKGNIVARKTSSEPMSNEKFIKLPATASIQTVIRALPKPSVNQLSADGKSKPRYFVVKKIIKLPVTKEVPKALEFNIPRGTILTKVSLDSKSSNTQPSVNMSSTDNIEDSVPKPTSGLGILFGVTNSMVVIEFLLKLKTLPELWRCELQNKDPVKYNKSVSKLCRHLNNRFNLNISEFEMLLSIQRAKDWYYLMLRSIQERNKDPNNAEPYKHRFPIYFNILRQYLTADADVKGIPFNEIIDKSTTPAANASTAHLTETSPLNTNETKTKSPAENVKTTEPHITASAATPSVVTADAVVPSSKDNSYNQEVTADSLIEFDADTLYDQESSEEEAIEEFDESIFFNDTTKGDVPKRKYTKVYIASFECDICRKTYKRSCDLKKHRVVHFPPQFECARCSQKFYFKHMAEKCTHIRNKKYKKVDKSSGERRIWPKKIFRFNMICEICGNSYRSIGSLNTHKRDKHFNQRNTCVVCNFTALSNWRIVQHQRKRHIVEPGLPEEVAKKSRARTESKTSFSNEARQAFDWRREMRKTLKPGEKFYGCCRCKIIFNTRKEKVLHNKVEHPITEYTVLCLLCLPTKVILSNANCARRHYTDIHKVPWYEIDGLVKCTKPIFNFLNQEEIELLKASENYKELLDELLMDKKLVENLKIFHDEATKAVDNLPHKKELDDESTKIEVECSEEQNVYVDGIVDDYNEINYKHLGYASINEHNYSEEHVINEGFNEIDELIENRGEELYSQQASEEVHTNSNVPSNDREMENYIQNEQEYVPNFVGDFVEDELVEESIVVEEYIDEVIGEDEDFI